MRFVSSGESSAGKRTALVTLVLVLVVVVVVRPVV